MNTIKELITNKAIVIPALAWFIAQTIKVISVIIKEKKIDFTRFVGSGGMPSSHAAFVTSLAAVVGKTHGWDSVEFGMSVAIALIIMYDAAGVRRATGKQAEALNKLIFSHKENMNEEKNLKELIGHSPFEVVMGALLGIILGILLS